MYVIVPNAKRVRVLWNVHERMSDEYMSACLLKVLKGARV